MSTSTPLNLIDHLFPRPRNVLNGTGTHRFSEGRIVSSQIKEPGILRSARKVRSALLSINVDREVAAHPGKGQSAAVELIIDPKIALSQGYILSITSDAITLTGHDESGLAYAATTRYQP
jgi:N-acetyl-beta-hexosaminidase